MPLPNPTKLLRLLLVSFPIIHSVSLPLMSLTQGASATLVPVDGGKLVFCQKGYLPWLLVRSKEPHTVPTSHGHARTTD
jgi:hypothetical protein